MSLTLTNVARLGQTGKPTVIEVLDVVMDSSYPTGGEDLDLAARYPDMTIRSVRCEGRVTSSGVPSLYRFGWDRSAKKLYGMKADGSAELDAATNLSTVTVEVTIIAE